jgi:hypothetical protein
MKTNNAVHHILSAAIAVLLLAAITGCQESSITSPTGNPEASGAMKLKPQTRTEVFPLNGILRVPGRVFNSHATINGSVTCSFTSTQEKGLYLLDIDLSTEAILMLDGNDKAISKVSGSSHDQIYVSEEGIALLEKSYKLEGPMNQLRLHVRFLLTSDGIELNAMWLERTKVRVPEIDGN